jgi:hypothetical protein
VVLVLHPLRLLTTNVAQSAVPALARAVIRSEATRVGINTFDEKKKWHHGTENREARGAKRRMPKLGGSES